MIQEAPLRENIILDHLFISLFSSTLNLAQCPKHDKSFINVSEIKLLHSPILIQQC